MNIIARLIRAFTVELGPGIEYAKKQIIFSATNVTHGTTERTRQELMGWQKVYVASSDQAPDMSFNPKVPRSTHIISDYLKAV